MAKPAHPVRPKNVPSTAEWVEQHQNWQSGERQNGSPVGTWTGWLADGTLKWRCGYSKKYPGALEGDVDSFLPDGSLDRFDRYRSGFRVGFRTAMNGELSREPLLMNHVRVEKGPAAGWEAWLVDGVTLVVKAPGGEEQRSSFEFPQHALEALRTAAETVGERIPGASDEDDDAAAETEPRPSPELASLAKKWTRRKGSETPAAALERLRGFVAVAREAGASGLPKVRTSKGWDAKKFALMEKRLGLPLPPSVRETLTAVGGLRLSSAGLSVAIAATPRELDFDESAGVVHDSGHYANIYGMSADDFDPEAVADKFVRLALATYSFDDEDPHEDGDVAVVVLGRTKAERPPAGVWQVPNDDGYLHERLSTRIEGFPSVLIDRVIRCFARNAKMKG